MKTEHHIDELFVRLNEVAQQEVLRIAKLPVKLPLVPRESEEFRAVFSEYLAPHRQALLPAMLRMRDWPDSDIEKLVSEGALRIGEPTRIKGVRIKISLGLPEIRREGEALPPRGILLPDLAAASEALTDAFLALSMASRPLGEMLEPPEGVVTKGSVGFSLPGGLLGAGVGLLVIAGSGLIAPPLAAYLGGAALTSVGLIDKWLEWKKTWIEIKEAEAKLDQQKCEESNAAQGHFAHSSLVPRHVVQAQAERWGLTEECANHLLNRCIPVIYALGNRIPRMSIEMLAENPLVDPPWPPPKPKPLPVFTGTLKDGTYCPELVRIPSGTFLMGSPQSEQGRQDDERQHEVTLRDFAIGKYAVTFDEFDKFAKATGWRHPSDFGWGRGRRPVVDVSWNDAVEYTEWLSRETGRRYRLPTEAEWEYAARAGTRTAYWWGDEMDRGRANVGMASNGTVPVDAYEPNPWGLYNMLGNTWEWTCSEYRGHYDGSETRCMKADKLDGQRVIRGGSWLSGPEDLRSATRGRDGPGARLSLLGFRLAQDL